MTNLIGQSRVLGAGFDLLVITNLPLEALAIGGLCVFHTCEILVVGALKIN